MASFRVKSVRTLTYGLVVAVGLTCLVLAAQDGSPPSGSDQASSPQKALFPQKQYDMNRLTPEEQRVILRKGTERAFTGQYWNHFEPGLYHCRNCGVPLYRSDDKFQSECGWPSFDAELPGAVRRLPDADGRRTEIVCAACGAHLGHVFLGEGFTEKNTRHCVNSISLVFHPLEKPRESAPPASSAGTAGSQENGKTEEKTETALFAGGCFWGVEHFMEEMPGVISATSGYTGGLVDDPDYKTVSTGRSGHAEVVQVVFDPTKTNYETIARRFFEIHDPTQVNRQGPDVGTQYRSAVYYYNDEQRETAEKLIQLLVDNGYRVATHVLPAGHFYPAEEYHQDYIEKHPSRAVCHRPVPRFEKRADQ